MLQRVLNTGNATFAAAELTAIGTYAQTMASVSSPQGEALAEFGYWYACWASAITQIGDGLRGDFAGITGAAGGLAGHNPTVPLDYLATRCAAKVRSLVGPAGFGPNYVPIPAFFYVAVSGVPTEAAEGASYAVGDTFNVSGGGNSYMTLIKAVGKVLTVTSGGVETLSISNMGLYTTIPANDVATSGTSGSGDNNLTVTMTWAQFQT